MYFEIRPLAGDELMLRDPELGALARVWQERKGALEGEGVYDDFLRRLQREWAIETGIIERLYTWDRGVTEVLIHQGIDASIIAHHGGIGAEDAEGVAALIEDQLGIVEGLFAFVKGEQQLTEHFIRSLQEQFTTHQGHTDAVTPEGNRVRVPVLRGQYKNRPNNPRRSNGKIHEYCPPERVVDEMGKLLSWFHAIPEVPPETSSAWLHHRFTQIHPFQDGNGRVARTLATIVFLRAGLFPLVIRDKDRKEYIKALEEADAGGLSPLIRLFARRQRDAILSALGLEQQARQAAHAEKIIESALTIISARAAEREAVLNAVFDTAADLTDRVIARFGEVASRLDRQLEALTPPGTQYRAKVDQAFDSDEHAHYFYNQITETARALDYFANTRIYRSWVRMAIQTDSRFEIVISFHGHGFRFQGVLCASSFSSLRVPREGGGSEVADLRPAATDLFQFNYAEDPDSTSERFSDWLESTLAIGLTEWKRTLTP